MKTRCYSDLQSFLTFSDRFEYLKLGGGVGRSTFGFDRYLNQRFYGSREWKDVRDHVIVRDNGCNLGVFGHEVHVDLLVHHMNPVSVDDILGHEAWILNPDFLITTNHSTHNAIHYGTNELLPDIVTERSPRDTSLW